MKSLLLIFLSTSVTWKTRPEYCPITNKMHAVENAIVNIPALSTPFILVAIIKKNKELNELNPVPNIFQIKFFLKDFFLPFLFSYPFVFIAFL